MINSLLRRFVFYDVISKKYGTFGVKNKKNFVFCLYTGSIVKRFYTYYFFHNEFPKLKLHILAKISVSKTPNSIFRVLTGRNV